MHVCFVNKNLVTNSSCFEWKIWNIEKVIVSVVVLHQLATDLFEFVML